MRRLPLRRWLTALSIAALSTWSVGAVAGPPEPSAASIETARSLAKQGLERFKAGDHAEAVELLDQAYALYPAPTIALLRARSLVELGKLVEAAKSYELAAGAELDANATQPMREATVDAKSELGALLPRIPALSIGILGARTGIVVRLNGELVPETSLGSEMLVNPGVYLINAIENGASVASERVTLEEGARRAVVLRLPAPGASSEGNAKPGRGAAQRVAGWASIGVGAAGLAVGIGAGVHMMNQKAILDAACPYSMCPSSAEGDLESFRAARVASTIGYGVGFAGVGAGLVLLLLTPSEQANAGAMTAPKRTGKNRLKSSAALERPRVTPWVGLGSAGVKGAF
jgi:hypothetical protein